jgi:ArsR family transcriptional regulator
MSSGIQIKKMKSTCEDVSQLLRALGHPQRLMLLAYLTDGEKNVTELVDLCDISQSQLSQFLTRMKSEGLLTSRRDGVFQYYSIQDSRVVKLIKSLNDIFCR